MPWKLNGERWHLGDKGFPPGRKILWERPLLTRLLALVREVEPGLEVQWDARDAITLRVPGIKRSWAQWRTKDNEALVCRFLGKKGQLNLDQLDGLGQGTEIKEREGGDVLDLRFQKLDPEQANRLKALLGEHLRGFREVYGSGKGS
jgi:excinuclease ABC subunit A